MQKKNLLNLRLAVFIAISLIFGIITAYFFRLKNTALLILSFIIFIVLLLAFFIIFFKKNRAMPTCAFILIFILFFIVGIFSFLRQLDNYQNANLNGHYFTVNGKVEQSNLTDNGRAVVLSNVNVKGVIEGNLKYKIMLYVYGENELDIGDVVEFSASLKDKDFIYENSFSPYDLANEIKYTASITVDNIRVVSKDLTVFENCNLFLRDTLKSGLDYNEFSVAYAMLTGDAELMDYEIITSYRYLGVAHIFAVSGLHIGFIATALNFLLTKIKTKRMLKAIIITLILVFYSGICGFTASSIRATIMASTMLVLSAKGERYDGLSAVGIAAIVILLISPVQLFCVGFQLSFGVVIGILLLSKPIASFLVKRLKFPQKLSSSIGVVVSAQLFGIPILLGSFGYFSILSILANFILIPIIGIVFYFLFGLTVIGGILSIPSIMLFPINYVLKFINITLTAFDSQKLLIIGITLGCFAFLYYAMLLIASGLINLRFKTKLTSIIMALLVFVSGTVLINTIDKDYISIYVCGSESASITVISSDEENILVVSDVEKSFTLGNLRRLSNKNGIYTIDAVVFGGGFNYDMQVVISKLWQVFDIKKVCYYGQQDINLEILMENSFPDLEISSFNIYEMLPINISRCNYLEEGLGVDIILNGKRLVVLSTPDNFSGYDYEFGKIDFLIAGHNVEQLSYKLNPEILVSYRAINGFDDGESSGNFVYTFK